MAMETIIFVSAAGWQRFSADGQVASLPAWSQLQGPALVVVDFPDAVVGLQNCKGKAHFAAAQIEKTLRDQGAIDGESHVMLHRQLARGDMHQVFYTAIPSTVWQQYRVWADQQKDHCLLVPLAALLPRAARGGDAVILRAGKQLLGYAERDGQLLFASAMAFGEQALDFTVPAASLISQLQDHQPKDGQAWRLRWATVWVESAAFEQQLIDSLELPKGAQVQLLPQRSYAENGVAAGASALPDLLKQLPLRAIAAPAMARLAWLTDRALPLLSAAIVAIAVVFAVGAWWLHSQLAQERQVLAGLQEQAHSLQAQITAARELERPYASNEDNIQLARQIGYAVRYNPMDMLDVLREEAGDTIRIQRVQLTRENASNPARFRVDGVVQQGSSARLSQFLAAMQARGWQARAEVPFDGSIGAFAYYFQAQEPASAAPVASSLGRQAQP